MDDPASSIPCTVLTGAHTLLDQAGRGLAGVLPDGRLRELFRLEYAWHSVGVSPRYVVAADDRGVLGVLAVYPSLGRHHAGWTAHEEFHSVDAARWSRGVLLGSDGLAANTMAFRRDVPAVAAALIRHGIRVAADHRPDFVCLPQLVGGQLDAAKAVRPVPVVAGDRHQAVLDLHGGSFERYVMALPKHRRSQVRRERRMFLDSGLEVRAEPLTPVLVDRLAPLLHQVNAKYGEAGDVTDEWLYLDAIRVSMGGAVTALVVRAGAESIAFSLIWDTGDEWRVRCWGCDYTRPEIREFAVYFNAVMYEPALRAGAAGARQLWLGTGSGTAKRYRGASLEPVRMMAWSVADLRRTG